MSTVITEYLRWKQQGETLRTQAKSAMESRFRDLLIEAAQIAEEYKADFGAPLKPPPAIIAFRYKAAAKPKAKKAPAKDAKATPAKPVSAKTDAGKKDTAPLLVPKLDVASAAAAASAPTFAAASAAAAKPDPKVAALQKRLATARKKLDDARAAGQNTRNLEDKVYEIEDELKLATFGG